MSIKKQFMKWQTIYVFVVALSNLTDDSFLRFCPAFCLEFLLRNCPARRQSPSEFCIDLQRLLWRMFPQWTLVKVVKIYSDDKSRENVKLFRSHQLFVDELLRSSRNTSMLIEVQYFFRGENCQLYMTCFYERGNAILDKFIRKMWSPHEFIRSDLDLWM